MNCRDIEYKLLELQIENYDSLDFPNIKVMDPSAEKCTYRHSHKNVQTIWGESQTSFTYL